MIDTPWASGSTRGGDDYAQLHAAQRTLQDRLAGAALPSDVSQDVTRRLSEIADLVGRYAVAEPQRRDGWRADLPGRGMPIMLPYVVEDETEGALYGRVTFTRFYLGAGEAAHGGTQPLLFDDILGRATNHGLPGVARTAFLHVDYRQVTPLDVELRFEATRDRVEGRKRFGSARLLDASGTVLAEGHGLFVALLPGQP